MSDKEINVAETLAEIRGRVNARLSRTVPEIPELALPPLDPLRQARGVAEGWAGAMGVVNPRPAGPLNSMLQAGKRMLARSLRWFAFPQTQFNSGTVAALVRTEDMFADVNRNMVVLGQNLVDRQHKDTELERRIVQLEERVAKSESATQQALQQALQRASDAERRTRESLQGMQSGLQGMQDAVQNTQEAMQGILQGNDLVMQVFRGEVDGLDRRVAQLSQDFRDSLGAASQSTTDSLAEMSRSINLALDEIHLDVGRVESHVNDVQSQFWSDFARVRQELEAELRLVRQRLLALGTVTAVATPAASNPLSTVQLPAFDYTHFERRFRGKEEEIRERQSVYLPMLRDQAPVLDIACGRGEMLDLLREQGIEARGVDLDPDMVARCAEKKHPVTRADALAYLESCEEGSLGAVFSAQFVEHLPVEAYSRLIELGFSRLRAGGRFILETQNPECLAIYSQSFYLDPTHVRPVPAQQLRFLLEEAGFRDVKIHYLSPVARAGLPELPMQAGNAVWNKAAAEFNETYFGHMDYGITGVKPA